jgi:hypothetical protein
VTGAFLADSLEPLFLLKQKDASVANARPVSNERQKVAPEQRKMQTTSRPKGTKRTATS